jgi:Domain of unknown function (DUF222)/HNH endonuclease
VRASIEHMFPDLASAVDDVLSVDTDGLDDDQLAAALLALHRAASRLAAAKARLTAAFDARRCWAHDGSTSAAAWLGRHRRVPGEQARAEVRLARRLRTMPATAAALAAGDITVAHAQRLASLNRPPLERAFAESEALLVNQATTLPWAGFARAAAYWRQLAEPDGVEAEAAHDESLRRVHLSPGLTGTGVLDGLLTPLGRATVAGALDRIESEMFDADWADARARLGDAATLDDLARTPAQRRHDALVEMAERAMIAPADGQRPRPLVTVLVGLETFAGRVCELADGTVVAPGLVAGMLDRAVVERAVFDAPDRVMAVGQARLFTGAVRRAVEVRDRHCTHPGCTVPAERCEVDHVVPFAEGGPTTPSNGALLCPAHHRWRHRHGGVRSAPLSAAEAPPAGAPPPMATVTGIGDADRAEVRAALATIATALRGSGPGGVPAAA